MAQEDRDLLTQDPVCSRVLQIIDGKRAANEEAMGRLNDIKTGWEDFRNQLDEELQTNLDLMKTEQQAVTSAREAVSSNRCTPIEDAALVAGKVIDDKDKVGLPLVRVQVTRLREAAAKQKTATTDEFGNFMVRYDQTDFGDAQNLKVRLRFDVFLDLQRVHRQDETLELKLGEKQEVLLSVPCRGDVVLRARVGNSVQSSVEYNAKLVADRLSNMKSTHTAVHDLSDVLRERVNTLANELSVNPPTPTLIPPAPEEDPGRAPPPDVDPGAQPGGAVVPSDADPGRDTPVVVPLVVVDAGGVVRPPLGVARLRSPLLDVEHVDFIKSIELRALGITTLEELTQTDDELLKKVFAPGDIRGVKKSAAAELKKERQRRRLPDEG